MNSAATDKQSFYPVRELPPDGPLETRTVFVPTAVQLERVNKLNRFNRWAIYVPLGLLITAVLGLFIYLLIIAIWPPYEDTLLFLSGIADLIFILFMLPVVLVFGLLLAGLFGGSIYWRKSRKEDGDDTLQKKYGRLRLLLWKVDQKLSVVYRQTNKIMPQLANPVIRINALIAYINSWLVQLTKQLNRHDAE